MGYNYLISNMRCKGCEQDFYQQFKSTLNSGRYIESLLFISYFLLAWDVLRSGHKPQSAFQIFWNCKIQRMQGICMLYYMQSKIGSIQNSLANMVRQHHCISSQFSKHFCLYSLLLLNVTHLAFQSQLRIIQTN